MNPRRLKIEAVGDFAHRKVRPRIRLGGQWLEKAGFRPGSHVSVTYVTEGVLMLRSNDASAILGETKSQ